MAVSSEYVAYLLDQLRAVEGVRAKRMFGGHGLYADEFFFAIVSDGRLYLKTDEHTRADFVAHGMGPFSPPSGQVLKRYYEVPEEIVDDRHTLSDWARCAIRIAIADAAG